MFPFETKVVQGTCIEIKKEKLQQCNACDSAPKIRKASFKFDEKYLNRKQEYIGNKHI